MNGSVEILENLHKYTKQGYNEYFNNIDAYNKSYKKGESEIYNILSDELLSEIIYYTEIFNQNYSIMYDIEEFIDSESAYKRINNLSKKYYYKKNYKDTNYRIKKEEYLSKTNSEKELRYTFYQLLDNHLNESNKQSVLYVTTLENIIDELKFINNDNFIREHVNIDNKYLINLTIILLKKLSSYSNDKLDDDYNYAIAIAYQTLLRSLFILINDINLIAYFNDYYNDIKKDNNTIINGIIKTAFISNYYDDKKYSKVKENK